MKVWSIKSEKFLPDQVFPKPISTSNVGYSIDIHRMVTQGLDGHKHQ